MHTVKRHARDKEISSLSESADRTTIAREQAALFQTRLALARMSSGCSCHLHDVCSAHAPLRTAWLAEAQRNFQAWLDSGGFTQHDGLLDASADDGLTDVRHGGQQDNICPTEDFS
jgi:hypothetical protein